MKKSCFNLIFSGTIILISFHCARISGSPTGGPKDKAPPKILKSTPPNETLNFKEKKIKIYFDEYVQIKNPLQNLVVSPPLKFAPKISPSSSASKFINVRLSDTLKKNTTYVINFGQGIVDFNEGNILRSYKYVFSTGNSIDSLTFSGKVRSSYSLNKEKFIKAMLYEVDSIYTDSTVYKSTPSYITSTQDTLEIFKLTYLSSGKYRLFALKDNNNDNKFTPQLDEIAFYDDDIIIPTDTMAQDYKIPKLRLFKEVLPFALKYPSLVSKNRIVFGYQGANSDSINIKLMTKAPKGFKYKILKDLTLDTLNYWMTPVEGKLDSMVFKVSYKEKIQDTFTIRLKKLYRDSLVIASNHSNSISIKDTFWINSTTPLHEFNKDSLFFVDKDTLEVPYQAKIDTIKNRLLFDFDLKEEETYIMRFLPGTLKDMFGESNDTLDINLSVLGKSAYGNLYAKIYDLPKYPILLKLIDSNGMMVKDMYVTEPQDSYDFEWLPPSNYTMKIIFDDNGNKKWDTGSVLNRRQPEKIYYFPPVNVRANWDINQEFLYDPNAKKGKLVISNTNEGEKDEDDAP